MKIKINKADPVASGAEIQDATIKIRGSIEEFFKANHIEDIETGADIYDHQAEVLEKVLFNSLPQGTYDRLVANMIKRKATLYVGKTRS